MSAEALRHVWLFSEMSDEQLESISSFTFEKSFDPGELIVEEGQTGNGLYVIVSGNVEVLKGDLAATPQVLAKRGAGDVFGEMALLGEWPRTASVRALDDVQCLGIDRWVFLSQLERQPKVTIRLLQILAQRLRDSDARLAE
ncbi:MAG: cyclic nucleotide-binding domain-containing protein [Chloroflexi bacterium]|nr:cyclic nucleotide-binding domain-containing protein [Chloroflexota bacterium]MCH8894105.1 cyclic nucleotide-binding domain-containing protein [Chloroflexota bacterium]MCI0789370.1 cyclic nucleotide-binding domain-containing protein [Chloroflexota bacterium]MCI0801166.1 cyclic nucleotide-binding domain-containing protein [Chloroflexota bacterium]MCI0848877.1 cyclic nucleotide-binding domain-containing protein [Chloroflexota bacterium]